MGVAWEGVGLVEEGVGIAREAGDGGLGGRSLRWLPEVAMVTGGVDGG